MKGLFSFFKTRRKSAEDLEKRSFEAGFTLSQMVASAKGFTGLNVSAYSMLGVAAIFAAVRIRGETLSNIPFRPVEKRGHDCVESDDPWLLELLQNSPDGQITAVEFFQTMESHSCLTGCAYAHIERNIYGEPVRLVQVPSILLYLYLESRQNRAVKDFIDRLILLYLYLESRQNIFVFHFLAFVILLYLYLESRQNRWTRPNPQRFILLYLYLESRQNLVSDALITDCILLYLYLESRQNKTIRSDNHQFILLYLYLESRQNYMREPLEDIRILLYLYLESRQNRFWYWILRGYFIFTSKVE